MNFLLYTKHIT